MQALYFLLKSRHLNLEPAVADLLLFIFLAAVFAVSLLWLVGYALELRDGDPQDALDHCMAGAYVYLVAYTVYLVGSL